MKISAIKPKAAENNSTVARPDERRKNNKETRRDAYTHTHTCARQQERESERE